MSECADPSGLLYGEEAGRVIGSASPRLLMWCWAFDEWLAERRNRSERIAKDADEIAASEGDPPYLPGILQDVLESGPELSESARHLLEETAEIRCILRNTFREAMKAQDNDEYIRLIGIYGKACKLLLDLLKAKVSSRDRLDAYAREIIGQALQDVIKALGIGE